MILRTAAAVVFLGIVEFQSLPADDISDKLDAILSEVRALKVRVGRLEAEVRSLARTRDRLQESVPPRKQPKQPTLIQPRLPIRATPGDVLRLQIESPKELMKQIHSRERMLRNRPFPAETQTLPPRSIRLPSWRDDQP